MDDTFEVLKPKATKTAHCYLLIPAMPGRSRHPVGLKGGPLLRQMKVDRFKGVRQETIQQHRQTVAQRQVEEACWSRKTTADELSLAVLDTEPGITRAAISTA